MRAIGLRVCSNHTVYYTIIEKNDSGDLDYLAISQVNVPRCLNRPEALNFTRNTLLDILKEYEVSNAVIRIAEFGGTLKQVIVERFFIEGVIQECLASSSVDCFASGRINEITSISNMPTTDFKEYVNATLDYKNIPDSVNWSKLSKEKRESILACNAALELINE